jgi:predicted signal transduction protein with EAL and GGDEF domain
LPRTKSPSQCPGGRLELLAALGGDLVQGYHLARPMPADKLVLLLRYPEPIMVGRRN